MRKYTDDDIIVYAAESFSLAQLLSKLGLRSAGGNYAHMKKHLQRLNVDTSHWTGQAWSADQRLKDWSKFKKMDWLKKHLIRERGHRCEKCLTEMWFDDMITLEVHHIDGDRTNNVYENLQLLCPNCHSYTDNWRGKNKK
jgi:5-methylcytosine-specific restriction endonuclease McrA